MNLSEEKHLLVISSYPEKGITHGKGTVGIASYAKNTLLALTQSDKDIKITVLAEKLQDSEKFYQEGNIKIKRVWKRGSFATFWHLTSEILRNHKNTKNIMIELELAMLGSVMQIIPLPIFLTIMRLIGKKVTVVMHQVIPDLADISGHINLEKNSFRLKLYNLGIQFLYRSILALSSKIIVFDEILKNKLKGFGDSKKISVIPHGVEEFKTTINKDAARKKLNIKPDQFVVLSFGFLAWYKGTDWIINAIKQIKKDNNIKLILAGGANPNHMDKPFYKKYIEEIEKICSENEFLVTGFVAEDDIATYYKASDLVVLPYRTLMSASGPLSIALSFKKPFLVSKVMEDIFETVDAKQKLEEQNLDKDDLSFDIADGLSQKILEFQKNPVKLNKIGMLSSELEKARTWKVIGKMYWETLFV